MQIIDKKLYQVLLQLQVNCKMKEKLRQFLSKPRCILRQSPERFAKVRKSKCCYRLQNLEYELQCQDTIGFNKQATNVPH